MERKEQVLSEIKTLLRILNSWGNAIAPSLNGKEVTCQQRLVHFVDIARNEFGMSVEDIEAAISND